MSAKRTSGVLDFDNLLVKQFVVSLEQGVRLREQLYRRQLERTIEVLEKTRHSFRSKQLKRLREEIVEVLDSD
jgi:hypothetical protein